VYFGRIKDSQTGRSVTDSVYFVLTDKSTGLSFPFTNDKPGHFRSPDVGTAIKEIGEQVDANGFVITVNVAGYKRATITRMPRKAQGPVELDVRLEPVVSGDVKAAGLSGAAAPWTWIILIGSLVPYALTWNVAGGGEWRFTMHTYPLYLTASMTAVVFCWQRAKELWRQPSWHGMAISRSSALRWIGGAAVIAAVIATYMSLPWFVVRETIAAGTDVSVETGGRDATFFGAGAGWSEPYTDGLTFRVSCTDRAVVRIPLPRQRDYQVVLRLDPVAPDRQPATPAVPVSVLDDQRLNAAGLHTETEPRKLRVPHEHVPTLGGRSRIYGPLGKLWH